MAKSNYHQKRQSFLTRLPRSYTISLGLLAIIVFALPLISIAASVSTNIGSKAFTTPTPFITPSVTISPQIASPGSVSPKNALPRITTSSLPTAQTQRPYYAVVSAIDSDTSDNLNMNISGLPFGLFQGQCSVTDKTNRITCSISGTPEQSGIYTVLVKVNDGNGGQSQKNLSLIVKQSQ